MGEGDCHTVPISPDNMRVPFFPVRDMFSLFLPSQNPQPERGVVISVATAQHDPLQDATGRLALRKASLRLVPLIALGYCAAYIDRVNISFAAVQMNRDLHFSASIYGLGAGLFFVSYTLCEVPSNLLLVRFGARRWLARIMLTWGLLAIGMMFVRTPIQFYVMRFLLGIAEAGFFPGVVFYLTEWFPPGYRARTLSRFYVALPLASTVMGSLAGGLLALNGRLSLAGWQWLFLVEGLPPLALSVLLWKYLPDKPADASWLDVEERAWLERRLAESAEGTLAPSDAAADLRAVVSDPRVWMIASFFFCELTTLYGWAFSAPVILQADTGFTIGQVGVVIAIYGLIGAAAMLLGAMSSDRTGERYRHIGLPMLLMAFGFIIGGLSTHPWMAVPAFALTVIGYNAAQGPALSLPSSFLSGRVSAIGYAFMNMIGMVGGFIGPYWMGRARDLTGNYQRGLLTLAVPSLIAAILIYLLKQRTTRTVSE
jgi:ACS family tartrate transporter-like MFS transporter